jgi:protease-4
MKQFLITLAGVFVGLLLFFVALPLLLIGMVAASAEPEALPSQAVLMLDLREGLSDQPASGALAALGGSGLSVMGVVTALHAAEDDDRVKGLLIRLPEGGMAPAAAEELRLAVKSFQRSGKRVVAHSQGLYPSGVVVASYMLGASADEFWMQDTASFQVTGLSNEEFFLKGLFDRYGVVPEFQQRGQYKTAVNPFLHETFTPAHREATLSWMTSVYESALAQAAVDRRQTPQAIRAALEQAPLSAEEARAARLIDKLGHWEAAEQALLDHAGKDAETIEFDDYAARVDDSDSNSGPTIAVVGAEGAIVTGSGSSDPFAQSAGVYSDDIAEAIYDAVEDDDIKAIVLRVSSPGGSDTASDQILAAVMAAKKAGKPVVVSMGTYAASGGYWISSKASSIVAHPSTLTGSIGVFGGKLAIGPALERFGVNVESVDVGGAYTGAFETGEPFDPEQRAEFSAWMDRIYQGFITRVAEGRKLDPARVQEIAQGRVWTGAQAKTLGLVDELGGFYQAVNTAKRLAKIDADAEVNLRRMPGETDFFEALSELFGVSAASVKTLAAAAWLLGDPRAEAVMDKLAEARLRTGGATVLEGARVD